MLLQQQQERLQSAGPVRHSLCVHLQQYLLQYEQQGQTYAQELVQGRVILAIVPQVAGEGPRGTAHTAGQIAGGVAHSADHTQGPAQVFPHERAEDTC